MTKKAKAAHNLAGVVLTGRNTLTVLVDTLNDLTAQLKPDQDHIARRLWGAQDIIAGQVAAMDAGYKGYADAGVTNQRRV